MQCLIYMEFEGMNKLNFAAIDIGTNAARLLIKNEEGKVVEFIRYPLRLGEDVFTIGEISREKQDMMMRMMNGFRQMMRMYKVKSYRACATSAIREAKNGRTVIKRIIKNTEIDIEIIDAKQEAEFLCCSRLVNKAQGGVWAYVDVGGGSTEVTFAEHGDVLETRAYKVGTLRMLNDKVDAATKNQLKAELTELNAKYGKVNIIGLGGNINKLFQLIPIKERDNLNMPIKSLVKITKALSALSVEQRMSDYYLKKDRADVIVPAAKIFIKVAECLQSEYIYVPKMSLADGILASVYYDYKEKGIVKMFDDYSDDEL